jgi:hypothetical protein
LKNYDISSNFIDMHIEDNIKFGIVLIILLMIYLCRRMAKKGSWIERKFSIDYDIIILAQFISYMAGYFLSARMIRSYSYSSGFG